MNKFYLLFFSGCLTCWCPCITFGQIAEIVDMGTSSKFIYTVSRSMNNTFYDKNTKYGIFWSVKELFALFFYFFIYRLQIGHFLINFINCSLLYKWSCVCTSTRDYDRVWMLLFMLLSYSDERPVHVDRKPLSGFFSSLFLRAMCIVPRTPWASYPWLRHVSW